jgi:hypothetical protein
MGGTKAISHAAEFSGRMMGMPAPFAALYGITVAMEAKGLLSDDRDVANDNRQPAPVDFDIN